MSEIQALDVRIPAEIIHNWGWFLLFGICLVLLGALAIVRSVAATVVSMLFFGWLLLIAAGIEIVQAVMVGKWAGLFQHWLSAALFGVLGALIVWRPVVTRRDLDAPDRGVLPGGRHLPIGHAVRDFLAGVGLARAQWPYHAGARRPHTRAMAGLRTLGDRPVPGNRTDFYGGAWIAVALRLRSAS